MLSRFVLLLMTASLVACGGSEPAATTTQAEVAEPAKTYEWSMVTTWPKNLPGMGLAPESFAEKVSTMSHGRLKVHVYGAGELVPALGVFEAVSQGNVEMGHGAAYYWKGKVPVAQFFTAVPFGLTAQEMNGWLLHGGGLELWRELYAEFDLMPFPGGNTGVQMAGWFNKEINSLEDMKGLKMRIPGLGGEVFEELGGSAINIAGGEIYTSMQTQVIDATEWVGPFNDLAFGLYQVADYYYYPGWQEPGPNLEFIVNMDAWNELPPDLQAIVENAALAVNLSLLSEYTARNNAALRELVDEHGVQLRRLPDDVLAEIARISEEKAAEVIDPEDELANRIFGSYQRYKKDVMAYHEISERAYINAR